MRVHVERDGQASGPFSMDELRRRVATGEVRADDLAWVENTSAWVPVASLPGVAVVGVGGMPGVDSGLAPPGAVVPWPEVSAVKFVVLSVCTLGLYQVYWFYRHWRAIARRGRPRIFPFFRAIFAPIWYHGLLSEAAAQQGRPLAGVERGAPLAYVLLCAAGFLPDPWWLVAMVSFVPLLPLVRRAEAINRESGFGDTARSPFRLRHAVVCLAGAPIALFVTLSTLNVLPSSQVVEGNRLPGRVVEFLRAEAGLSASETVLYFYSASLWSFEEEGNVVTDQGVISYYRDEQGLVVLGARYEDIVDVHVSWAQSPFEETIVEVMTGEEDGFVLLASREQRRDRLFVEEIMRRWEAARQREPVLAFAFSR